MTAVLDQSADPFAGVLGAGRGVGALYRLPTVGNADEFAAALVDLRAASDGLSESARAAACRALGEWALSHFRTTDDRYPRYRELADLLGLDIEPVLEGAALLTTMREVEDTDPPEYNPLNLYAYYLSRSATKRIARHIPDHGVDADTAAALLGGPVACRELDRLACDHEWEGGLDGVPAQLWADQVGGVVHDHQLSCAAAFYDRLACALVGATDKLDTERERARFYCSTCS